MSLQPAGPWLSGLLGYSVRVRLKMVVSPKVAETSTPEALGSVESFLLPRG